jgi:hypothetical protein
MIDRHIQKLSSFFGKGCRNLIARVFVRMNEYARRMITRAQMPQIGRIMSGWTERMQASKNSAAPLFWVVDKMLFWAMVNHSISH